jgi:RES domain-containing protein
VRVWRICRRSFAADAATSEGARLYGGRWNSRGVRVVYASTSLALAAMENFVNLEPNLQPRDLVSIEVDIPGDFEIERLDLKKLPRRWYKTRSESLCRFGDEWIRAGKTVAMFVPSAAIRSEWNALLNTTHTDFKKVKFAEPIPFVFDTRMFR